MKTNYTTEEKRLSLAIYMHDLSSVDLLSEQEEKDLLLKVKKWKTSKRLTKKTKQEGIDARDKLIKSNLRLVIKIAKEFRNVGLDYEDLISEGNIGLTTAIDKYDLEKGAKLSYYASFWIKQNIRRAISNKGRTIRLPVGLIESKLKVQKYIEQYEKNNGKKPDVQDISKQLKIPIKKVKKIIKLSLQCQSLNAPMEEQDGHDPSELADLIVNDAATSPLVLYMRKDRDGVLSQFLNKLDSRQRYILIRRFGLDGGKPQTLESIGQKFNLTRERIRQLELIALQSLKEMYASAGVDDINK